MPRDVPALSIETPGDSGHVFQRNQVDPRLINVRAGEYMPLWKMLPNATWNNHSLKQWNDDRVSAWRYTRGHSYTNSLPRSGCTLSRGPQCNAGLEEWRRV